MEVNLSEAQFLEIPLKVDRCENREVENLVGTNTFGRLMFMHSILYTKAMIVD